MKQMWKCHTCGTMRQWGTAAIADVWHAAAETGEVVTDRPTLHCETCEDNQPHRFSHNVVPEPLVARPSEFVGLHLIAEP